MMKWFTGPSRKQQEIIDKINNVWICARKEGYFEARNPNAAAAFCNLGAKQSEIQTALGKLTKRHPHLQNAIKGWNDSFESHKLR